jgi:hypothetical protein
VEGKKKYVYFIYFFVYEIFFSQKEDERPDIDTVLNKLQQIRHHNNLDHYKPDVKERKEVFVCCWRKKGREKERERKRKRERWEG